MSMGQQPRQHSDFSRALAAQLRAERAAANLTQTEMAKRMGISRGQLIRVEAEERILDTTQLVNAARALGLTVLEFVKRSEERLATLDAAGGADEAQVAGE